MIFFGDSSFFIGLYYPRDSNHDPAKMVWDHLNDNGFVDGLESLLLSDYILIEVFQTLQNKIGFNRTRDVHTELINECKIQHINRTTINEAIQKKLLPSCNHSTKEPRIGLVDGTSLVIMEKRKIPRIISFDDHFDSIPLIRRIYSVDTIPSAH